MTQPEKEIKISNTLLLLLKFSKQKECQEYTIENLKKVLADIYSHDMKHNDVLRVVLRAYIECLEEPRFQAHSPGIENVTLKLLQAPVERLSWSRKLFQTIEIDDFITVGDIYDSYIHHMLTTIMLTNVGWCRHVLNPEEALPVQSLSC